MQRLLTDARSLRRWRAKRRAGLDVSPPTEPSCGLMVARRLGSDIAWEPGDRALFLALLGGPGQGCGSTHPPTGSKPAMASRGPHVPGL